MEKADLVKKIRDFHNQIIEEATAKGIPANIITSLQFGDINIFPAANNSKHFKSPKINKS